MRKATVTTALMIFAMLSMSVAAPASAQLKGSQPTGPFIEGRTVQGPGIMGWSFGGAGIRGEHSNTVQDTPPAANGAGVYGESRLYTYPGVVGISQGNTDGVLGRGLNGIHGQSNFSNKSGIWGEHQGDGYGVAGSNASPARGAGIFTNLNGGDHVQAGTPDAPAFRVSNNGDVFIRGVQSGMQGPKGDPGDMGLWGSKGTTGADGQQGDPGPDWVTTQASCTATTACGCQSRGKVIVYLLVTASSGRDCRVTADNGACSTQGGGTCCVCVVN